jgi:hypothetical protein
MNYQNQLRLIWTVKLIKVTMILIRRINSTMTRFILLGTENKLEALKAGAAYTLHQWYSIYVPIRSSTIFGIQAVCLLLLCIQAVCLLLLLLLLLQDTLGISLIFASCAKPAQFAIITSVRRVSSSSGLSYGAASGEPSPRLF